MQGWLRYTRAGRLGRCSVLASSLSERYALAVTFAATRVNDSRRQECYAEILKAVFFYLRVHFRQAELERELRTKFQVDRVCFQEYRAQTWNKKKEERKKIRRKNKVSSVTIRCRRLQRRYS